MTNAYGYTVSNEGIITLPAVGQVSVAGLTTDEAARRIEQSIINAKLIKDPEVTVRLLNARVAVLGAVKSPQVVSLTSERNTILDILSRCGDIADTGLRQNVTLYQQEPDCEEQCFLHLPQRRCKHYQRCLGYRDDCYGCCKIIEPHSEGDTEAISKPSIQRPADTFRRPFLYKYVWGTPFRRRH